MDEKHKEILITLIDKELEHLWSVVERTKSKDFVEEIDELNKIKWNLINAT